MLVTTVLQSLGLVLEGGKMKKKKTDFWTLKEVKSSSSAKNRNKKWNQNSEGEEIMESCLADEECCTHTRYFSSRLVWHFWPFFWQKAYLWKVQMLVTTQLLRVRRPQSSPLLEEEVWEPFNSYVNQVLKIWQDLDVVNIRSSLVKSWKVVQQTWSRYCTHSVRFIITLVLYTVVYDFLARKTHLGKKDQMLSDHGIPWCKRVLQRSS